MSQAKEIIEHTVKNWPTNHERIKKSVNFSLTAIEKNRLIDIGYKSVTNFFNNK